jgi:malonyl-CoA/methylmalonyl-CoA synthetase
VRYFVEDATPALVVCAPESEAALTPIVEGIGGRALTLDEGGNGSLSDLAEGQSETFETVARGKDDLAAILYTSGTTGRSKGAMLSHENLLSNAQVLQETWEITDRDVLLHALPIFHTHGLFVAINSSLSAGAQLLFHAAFKIDALIADLPRATMMMGVPTFYTRLLGDARLTRELTANMRLFISGSAPLLAETHEEFEGRTGHRILERYGMTETNMNTSNPYKGARKAGTVGLPLPGVEVRICTPGTEDDVEPGGVGMIEVRGPNVFRGYWNMPEKTRDELRENGFFISGDLGQLDEDGYVQIVGREKDWIITGGSNVYPTEIEVVLYEAAGVNETAGFGIANADFGEAVMAAVVMLPGAEPDEAGLRALVGEQLARFKQPKTYVFLPELPRNTMGKVQKNALREAHG